MPYLRLLTNALVAGTLGAITLAHVVLLINPQMPLAPGVLFSLGWRLWVTAGLLLTSTFFLASLARYLSTRRGPGWLSLRLLAWMTTLVVGAGALLTWLNLSAFQPSIGPAAARRGVAATVTLAATAGVLLLVAAVHYGFGRRGSRVGGTLLGLAVLAAVVLPLVARGGHDPDPPSAARVRAVPIALREPAAGHVYLMLVDGASLDYVSPAAAQGRLPNVGRLLDGGASLTLFSIEPREPAPIWASVATARYPATTGVRGTVRHEGGWARLDLLPRYVFADLLVWSGVLRSIPLGPTDLRGAPLWRILEASDVPALSAGWPLAQATDRPGAQVLEARRGRDPLDDDRSLRLRVEDALASSPAQVVSVRYAALSGLAEGDRSDPVRRRRLAATYDFLDAEVGRLLARMAPDDLLLVVSGYRLESPSPLARLRDRVVDDAGLAAEASRSDGFLLAYGRHVSPGRKTVGAIVDVLPTVLYYLGLPVARDMDGFARTDLFVGTLTTGRPVSFIRSYE